MAAGCRFYYWQFKFLRLELSSCNNKPLSGIKLGGKYLFNLIFDIIPLFDIIKLFLSAIYYPQLNRICLKF